jgi:hypothetical protein
LTHSSSTLLLHLLYLPRLSDSTIAYQITFPLLHSFHAFTSSTPSPLPRLHLFHAFTSSTPQRFNNLLIKLHLLSLHSFYAPQGFNNLLIKLHLLSPRSPYQTTFLFLSSRPRGYFSLHIWYSGVISPSSSSPLGYDDET